MNIKDLKEKILDEIRYGELNYVPEWLGKTDMPRHAEDEKCFRDGVTCKRYTDAVIVKTAFDEFEKTDAPDINVGTKWIPCSERLPEERNWYLAVFKEPDTDFMGLPMIADYLMGLHTNYTTEDGWIIANCTDTETAEAEYFKKLKCVAWMPLPEPYELRGDDGETKG